MTNEELVVNMMNYSKYGSLSQVFIMNAITQFAEQVINSEEELRLIDANRSKDSIPFISTDGWIGVAKEIHEKLKENRYTEN